MTTPLNIVQGPSAPADTTALWLSTSHKDLRVSQAPGDRAVVLSPSLSWEGTALQEPSVWLYNGVWHMFYTGGSSGAGCMGHATAPTAAGPWTKDGAQVLGGGVGGVAGTVFHTNVYIEGSTIYVYYPDTSSPWTWKLATSTLAAPTTFTLVGSVFTPPANAAAQAGNSFVFKDSDGTYLFLYEAQWNNFQLGIAKGSSPSGTFTHYAIPLRTLYPNFSANGATLSYQNGGPYLFKEDDTYILYYHAGPSGRPTDIYRATSTDLINWTMDLNGAPLVRRISSIETDQTADMCVVPTPGGPVAAFWTSMQNVPALVGSISHSTMQPVLRQFDGYRWAPVLKIPDTTVPKSDYVSSTLASPFTTTTVGSDVAVTNLAITYTPTFTARATINARLKVSSSAAGAVTVTLKATPTTVVNSAPGITYPNASSEQDDMPASSTSYRTITVSQTLNLVAGTTYTIQAYVNNGAGAATTTVASGGQYTVLELVGIPN